MVRAKKRYGPMKLYSSRGKNILVFWNRRGEIKQTQFLSKDIRRIPNPLWHKIKQYRRREK